MKVSLRKSLARNFRMCLQVSRTATFWPWLIFSDKGGFSHIFSFFTLIQLGISLILLIPLNRRKKVRKVLYIVKDEERKSVGWGKDLEKSDLREIGRWTSIYIKKKTMLKGTHISVYHVEMWC